MSRRSSEGIPQSDAMKIIFQLGLSSGKYNTDFFIPSLVNDRISLMELNTFIGKIHEETNCMYVIRMFFKKNMFAFLCLLFLFVIGIIVTISTENLDPYDNSTPFADYFFPIIFGAFIIFFIWNIISLTKESKVLYKTIVDIIARNQASFQNAGLRWVVPQNLRWLELWMDYRINQQNYVAPPLYPNNYNANPMMNQYSDQQNYVAAPLYPNDYNANPMMNQYPGYINQ